MFFSEPYKCFLSFAASSNSDTFAEQFPSLHDPEPSTVRFAGWWRWREWSQRRWRTRSYGHGRRTAAEYPRCIVAAGPTGSIGGILIVVVLAAFQLTVHLTSSESGPAAQLISHWAPVIETAASISRQTSAVQYAFLKGAHCRERKKERESMFEYVCACERTSTTYGARRCLVKRIN